jgi:hypothetical protein
MNIDRIYSYLVGCTWFFLGGWLLTLLIASIAAFHPDLAGQDRR